MMPEKALALGVQCGQCTRLAPIARVICIYRLRKLQPDGKMSEKRSSLHCVDIESGEGVNDSKVNCKSHMGI